MKHVIIATFEGNADAIFAGVKEFPTEKIVLLAPAEFVAEAQKVKKEMEKFRIAVETEAIANANSLEEVFTAVGRIKAREREKQVMMNLSDSSGILGCAALSAAFVNGIKAFEIMDDKLVMFPILKFSYYDLLSEKKMLILQKLFEQKKISSLEELGKSINLGPSLINYHIYGNEKNPGLKELGLIEANREKGKINIELTTLGRLLLKQKMEKKNEKKMIIA